MKKTFTSKLILSAAVSLFCGGLMSDASALSEAARSSSKDAVFEASPCRGMIQKLNEKHKADLQSAFVKQLNASNPQLNVKSTKVIRAFASGSWSLFYVQTYVSDDIFLFYAGDPLTNRFVTKWSGWVEKDQETEIKNDILKDAPGIPPQLASCFAWYVTH
ncbi:MAG: hypothetical protein PHY92_01670 [Alphaproteobacteria bacterium]|nr:hypothetical protein [Alphaproteobacteria bacterium]